jgi:hypothetical protein
MPFIGNKPTAVPLSADDLEDNIISTAKIQDNAVTAAKYIEPIPFRNIIINGDMSIAQRATSASSLTSSGYHTVDRFRCVISSAGTWTISQSTTVPTGQGFAKSLKWDNTTADGSLGASDFVSVQQFIEGQNLQYLKKGTSNAESLTVSFWVRSNKTGTYILELKDNDNTRAISQSYTISSADTWEKKTLTFAGDTTGTLDNDNAASFLVQFALAAGSSYQSGTLQTSWGAETTANRYVGQVNLADSTSNEWYMTGLQVEVGTSASDFEFLPYDVNLQRCERYYHKNLADVAYWPTVSSTNSYRQGFYKFPSTMRATPTVSNVTFDAAGTTGSQHGTVFGVNAYINLGNSTGVTIFQGLIADSEL